MMAPDVMGLFIGKAFLNFNYVHKRNVCKVGFGKGGIITSCLGFGTPVWSAQR